MTTPTWMQISDTFWLRSDGPRVQKEGLAGTKEGPISMAWFARESGDHAKHSRCGPYGGPSWAIEKADEFWPPEQAPTVTSPWEEDPEFVDWLHLMGWVWTDQSKPHRLRHKFDSAPGHLRLMHIAWVAGQKREVERADE